MSNKSGKWALVQWANPYWGLEIYHTPTAKRLNKGGGRSVKILTTSDSHDELVALVKLMEASDAGTK